MRDRNADNGHFLASKFCFSLNVRTELNMFCRDDEDVLREEGMRECLVPFDSMDNLNDDFYTSRYYAYPPN